MKVTYYGHSCFELDLGDARIILDPFISPNELAKSIDVNSLRADFVLVSHAHGDHIADVETIARNSGSTIVASYEVASHYGAKDFKYHPMNIGGRWDFGKWSIKTVNAVHSSVFPDGSNGGSPMGFIIQSSGKTIYYSGDTALHMDMQLIGKMHKLDAAFLCLGDNFTMGYEEALMASDMIKCDHIIGMHFDTFPYIKINHEKAIQRFSEGGKKLVLPSIGESWYI
jgi:L-ascorbate metabolism protein UlaG (beta-lactamase superfamily)